MFFRRYKCLFTDRMFQKKTSKKFVKIPWLKHVIFFSKNDIFQKSDLVKFTKLRSKKSPYSTLKLGLKTRFCRNLFTLKIDLGSVHTKGVPKHSENFLGDTWLYRNINSFQKGVCFWLNTKKFEPTTNASHFCFEPDHFTEPSEGNSHVTLGWKHYQS